MPFSEQLRNVKMNRNLDLFRTTCKVLRIPKAIERIWSRQRLMPWFHAVMKLLMYERANCHMSRNTEAYQSFPRDIGPVAYKRAFMTLWYPKRGNLVLVLDMEELYSTGLPESTRVNRGGQCGHN